MDCYVDIQVLPGDELKPSHIINALFTRLHQRLARLKRDDVGVSFPNANELSPSLGTLLRIHGRRDSLELFMGENWFGGLNGHIDVGRVTDVPVGTKHVIVKRMQVKSNPERLRRRQMRRHGITEEEARARVPDRAIETLHLPFVTTISQSTGQRFNLFLAHVEVTSAAPGKFNAYGLSQTTTVPSF